VGAPGVDALTGYGIVDARAAFAADPAFHVDAGITDVDLSVRDGATRVRVRGSVDADRFAGARVMAAPEAYPDDWIEVGDAIAQAVHDGTLAEFDPKFLRGSRQWLVRVVATHENGRTREARYAIDLGGAQ
jgi:hypothetical protein